MIQTDRDLIRLARQMLRDPSNLESWEQSLLDRILYRTGMAEPLTEENRDDIKRVARGYRWRVNRQPTI
jgi:hypothetical protein